MNIVIREFYDLTDGRETKSGTLYWHYLVGDIYPRLGKTVKQSRIEELASANNTQGVPLIEVVDLKARKAAEEEAPTQAKRKAMKDEPEEQEA